MTDAETIIARVLGEHRCWPRVNSAEGWLECPCGERIDVPGGLTSDGYSFVGEADFAHEAHVATEVARALRDAALLPEATTRVELHEAWLCGHAAGRDYQGDGWNSDAHDPADDSPYAKTVE